MDLYWPVSTLSDAERIQKTANRVGLSVPGETMLKEEIKVQETIKTEMPRKNGLIDSLMRNSATG